MSRHGPVALSGRAEPAPADHTLGPDPAGGPKPLPHYLRPGLRLAFIGYNPGLESARAGHYYAHRGNVFWRQLAASGLVGRPVTHMDDHLLMDEAGIGFVDLCCRPTLRAGELGRDETRAGAQRLLGELQTNSPQYAVFSGRGIYQLFGRYALSLGSRDLAHRPYGEQPEHIDGSGGRTALYVVPSSSGLASRWHRERLAWLRKLLATLTADSPHRAARPGVADPLYGSRTTLPNA